MWHYSKQKAMRTAETFFPQIIKNYLNILSGVCIPFYQNFLFFLNLCCVASMV